MSTTRLPPTPRLHFDPPEDSVRAILDELVDPAHTLGDIASRRNVPIDAFTLWMTRPDIAERIDALENAFARRVRLLAAGHLGMVVSSLTRILEEFNEDGYVNPCDLKTREHKRRTQESVRKTAAFLVRLTQLTPGPTRTRATPRAESLHPAAHEPPTLQSIPADPPLQSSVAEPTPQALDAPTTTALTPPVAPESPSTPQLPAPAVSIPKSAIRNPQSEIPVPLTISGSPPRPLEKKLTVNDLPEHLRGRDQRAHLFPPPRSDWKNPNNWPKPPP